MNRLFQFLIGRLKKLATSIRLTSHSSVSIPYRQTKKLTIDTNTKTIKWGFQFLIGRLKNFLFHSLYISLIMFQFLIGRLKNERGKVGSMARCTSFQFLIGRLKNQAAWHTSFYMDKIVSIPYRQTKKLSAAGFPASLCSALFQFLIGRLKNLKIWSIGVYTTFVSIPYRQTKKRYTPLFDPGVMPPVSIPYRQTKKL